MVLVFRLIYHPPALHLLGICYRPIHLLTIFISIIGLFLASRLLYFFSASGEARSFEISDFRILI